MVYLLVFFFIHLYVNFLFTAVPVFFAFSTFAFSALTLLVGRQEEYPACKKLEWWGTGVVICLERDADLNGCVCVYVPVFICF